MERPARNSYLRILDSRGAPDRAAAASGWRGTNKISEASKTYYLRGSTLLMAIHKAPAASSPRCFFAAARTLDSGFWTRYGSLKSATLDPGLRTPDSSGLRTPDSGLRTPDSGPGRPAVPLSPDSGLRTLESVSRTASMLSSGLWTFETCFSHSLREPWSRRQGSSASMQHSPGRLS